MPQYKLLKPVSVKILEEAGACERELHKFAFLAMKACYRYKEKIGLLGPEYLIEIAQECEGGIEWLIEHGFIAEEQSEYDKWASECPYIGSDMRESLINWALRRPDKQ